MSSDNVRTFDINRVKVVFDGQNISGWGEGDVIQWEPDGERYGKSVGVGGSVQRARMNNRSGTVTLIVQYGSEANDVLQRAMDRDDQNNSGVAALTIEDLGGGFKLVTESAWVSQDPGVSFGDGNPEREWVLHTGRCEVRHGSLDLPAMFA